MPPPAKDCWKRRCWGRRGRRGRGWCCWRGEEGEGVEVEEGRREVSRWGLAVGCGGGRREGRCRAAGARAECFVPFCLRGLACAVLFCSRWQPTSSFWGVACVRGAACSDVGARSGVGGRRRSSGLPAVLHWFDTEGCWSEQAARERAGKARWRGARRDERCGCMERWRGSLATALDSCRDSGCRA